MRHAGRTARSARCRAPRSSRRSGPAIGTRSTTRSARTRESASRDRCPRGAPRTSRTTTRPAPPPPERPQARGPSDAAEPFHQQGGAIGAEAEIGGVAERVHAARAHDEMQAGRENDGDQHVGAEHQRIGRERLRQDGERTSTDEQRSARPRRTVRGRPDRRFRAAGRACRLLRTPPSSPCGRTISTDRHDDEFGDQRQLGKIHVEGRRNERDRRRCTAP